METRRSLMDMSKRDKARWVTYRNGLAVSLAGYILALAAARAIVPDEGLTVGDRLVMMVPMIPCLYGIWVIHRFLRSSDEMVQMLHYKSMAVGFGAAMALAITLGFAGLPGDPTQFNQLAPWIIFAVGMSGWGIAAGVLQARHS